MTVVFGRMRVMPWDIVTEDAGCDAGRPFGVRVRATGALVGCHPSLADAQKQVVALHASEAVSRIADRFQTLDDLNLVPTAGMVEEARRGLDWRDEFNRGGTEVGIARARDISNRARLSPDTVMRMHSFFSRHEVDKQGEGFRPGEEGFPSNGRIAWALWGGDPGQSWARKMARQIQAIREES